MKRYAVTVSKDAEGDLEAIYSYIARADGIAQANAVEDRLMEAVLSLEKTPARGKVPPEMFTLGVTDFRELQLPPWRIFYYINHDVVGVVAILDGRRNVAELLQRRLLR